jgi:hypothetical protein
LPENQRFEIVGFLALLGRILWFDPRREYSSIPTANSRSRRAQGLSRPGAGWPLEAICVHLEAVTFGDITRLLINVPPGFMKSLLTDVFWPAWEWGPMNMPHLRYVAFSYSDTITTRDNNKMVRLVSSPSYRQLWGDRFIMTKTGERKIENNMTGFKLATSVGGVGTGERGDRVILDDPHNVIQAESALWAAWVAGIRIHNVG